MFRELIATFSITLCKYPFKIDKYKNTTDVKIDTPTFS